MMKNNKDPFSIREGACFFEGVVDKLIFIYSW